MVRQIKNDLTGREFGLLTVIGPCPREYDADGKVKNLKGKCKCECGNYAEVTTSNLLSGDCKSCGCLRNKYFKFTGRPPKDKSEFCPYPCNRCSESFTYGRCCQECDKKGSCVDVCRNTPDKCGRDKARKEREANALAY